MAAVNDILRLTLSGSILSIDLVQMVFHYVVIAGSETDYDSIATNIAADLATHFAGMEAAIADEVQMTNHDLYEWDFTSHEFDGKASGTNTVLEGTGGSTPEPNGIALLMRFHTEELRRQARKFVPGMIEANVANDALQSSVLTPAIATAALLNNDITAGGATLRPCTFNSTPSSARYETHSKFTQTSFVNALVAYQRRRQPGSGA